MSVQQFCASADTASPLTAALLHNDNVDASEVDVSMTTTPFCLTVVIPPSLVFSLLRVSATTPNPGLVH